MSGNKYYFSIQFSAIQKTVLRHDRLWSIAGTSQILSRVNELGMRSLVTTGTSELLSRLNVLAEEVIDNCKGTAIVSGGGKFTASFDNPINVVKARDLLIRLISTTLPMLEFQCSQIVPAGNLQQAKDLKELKGMPYPGLINELNEHKRCFRGYGVSFNPYLRVCDECGEYPGVKEQDEVFLCSLCLNARKEASKSLKSMLDVEDDKKLTSLERIYKRFAKKCDDKVNNLHIPFNFDDLFSEKQERKRLAVWSSDINGMGNKVPVWLGQKDEKEIIKTFDQVTNINVEIITEALFETFKDKQIKGKGNKTFIPFRLIVAGGDDLCIVMRDKDILSFGMKFSKVLHKVIDKLEEEGESHLSTKWLSDPSRMKKEDGASEQKTFKPHSFGGAFIVASVHTPFKKMHQKAEHLMKDAKVQSDRKDNCLNWCVLSADEETVSEKALTDEEVSKKVLTFEKPLYIDRKPKPQDLTPADYKADGSLCLTDYLEMTKDIKLSGSHLQQIAAKMIELKPESDASMKLEIWLKRLPASSQKDSAISKLLKEEKLREEGQKSKGLSFPKIATLLEIMSIKGD